MKCSLSVLVGSEYIFQMYSVCDGEKTTGEQGKEIFNALGRCWVCVCVFFYSSGRANSLCTHKIKFWFYVLL